MPALLVDRVVQKQSDKLLASDALIQYGILIGSSNVGGQVQEDTFCIVGAIPVLVDDPTPSCVPTSQLLGNAEKISELLCGGIQVLGVYVFLRATSRESSLLGSLESSLNSFPSHENSYKFSSNKVALQITSNYSSARVSNGTSGGTSRQADIKFTSLAEQYVFLQSSIHLNLQLCGNSDSESIANLYGGDADKLFHNFDKNVIVQVDGKYMPSDIARNIPIGHLPVKEVHKVQFYPERNVLLGSDTRNNSTNSCFINFKGTFHFKAYVHEKKSTEDGLNILLDNLKHSIVTRCKMCSLPDKGCKDGYIARLPLRYEVVSLSTVLTKCFSSYFILSKDDDVSLGFEEVKEAMANVGIVTTEASTHESISGQNYQDESMKILGKCCAGEKRVLCVEKDANQKKIGNDGGDVDVHLGEKDCEYQIEDATPRLENNDNDTDHNITNEVLTDTNNDRTTKHDSNAANPLETTNKQNVNSSNNMPLLFVGLGLAVVLLAIVLMFAAPPK